MVAGFAAIVLIAYNGILDKPGSGIAEIGVILDYGYWVALVASLGIGDHRPLALPGAASARSEKPRAPSSLRADGSHLAGRAVGVEA